jgi:hypothetical protein
MVMVRKLGFDIIKEPLAISELSGENYAEKFVASFWNIYLLFCVQNTLKFNYLFLVFLG